MDYLKVFTSFAEVIEPLTDEERGRLFLAMLKYAEDGTIPAFDGNERFVWAIARQGIDREAAFLQKQMENGSKGGRPKKTHENPTEPTETQQNPNEPKESQKTHKDKDKDKDNSSKENTEKRHKYGEYKNVLLSDEELEKLKAEFPDYLQRIERLSEYIAKTGKSYKSHLATIRSWARSEKKEPDTRKSWMKQYIGGTK